MKRLSTVVLAAVPLVFAATAASADQFVRMLAGPAGGSWYPYGAKMAEMWEKNIEGITTSNAPGGGVGNMRDIQAGNAEIGWTFGNTAYQGYNGQGKFKKPTKDVLFFANLYPGILQIAVPKNSDIKSLRDINGKRVSPGKTTFAGNIAFETLIALYGITYEGIKKAGGTIHRVGFRDSAALLKDGHIDVFAAMTTAPNSSFIAIDFQPGFRMLPVEEEIANKYIEKYPGFIKTTIEKGVYTSVTEDVPAIAAPTVLVINKSVSSEIAYQLAKVLWEHHRALKQVNKYWENVKLADALDGSVIPVHPGAMKYYKEKGVAKK